MFKLVVVLSALSSACRASEDGTSDLSVTDLAAQDTAVVRTIRVVGTVSLATTAGLSPLAGVMVCQDPQGAPCATSSTSGVYMLEGLPYDQDIALRFSSSDIVATLVPMHQRVDRNGLNVLLFSPQGLEMLAATAGRSIAPGKGTLLVTPLPTSMGTALAGTTLALEPPQGEGPYYFAGSGPAASATDSAQYPGFTLFFNITPGTAVNLSFGTAVCLSEAAWQPSPGRFSGPISADAITSLLVTCG